MLHTNNYHNYPFQKLDGAIAVGAKFEIKSDDAKNAFVKIESFLKLHSQQYCFGYFSYDLKNDLTLLHSKLPDYSEFPAFYFFIPQHILIIKNNVVEIISDDADKIFEEINSQKNVQSTPTISIQFQHRTSKEKYLSDVNALQQHICNGTIYEINYCQEFFAENISISSADIFTKLNKKNGGPFTTFFKHQQFHVLCTSPERFISKHLDTIISQPIKGTIKRGTNEMEDEQLKNVLKNSEKEQAENVMIVDLVRNDLAQSAETGTVEVPDLCGIYSFATVHQMISTVTAKAKKNISNIEIIKNAFPMGSMTGAPKYTAMQLIEQYEKVKRGLYSGSVGYFTPEGDFDFNVVIRTLLYNAQKKYLSYSTGSAITLDADAAQEYDECLLKATALFDLFK